MRLPPRRAREYGVIGEDTVAGILDAVADVVALHHRRPVDGKGRREAIDHLVVTGSGVWVVDAKTHYGPLQVQRSGGVLSPRSERLFINNRDRTTLVETLRRQVALVARVLLDAGYTCPVHGALCFVGATMPWVSEEIAGIPLVDEAGLRDLIQRPGDTGAEQRWALAAELAAQFVTAP